MQPQDLYHEVRLGADIKDFLLYLHSRNTGELMLRDIQTEKIESLPTLLMSALPKPHTTSLLPSLLYRDYDGRQCLKLESLLATTVDVVSEAVASFYDLTACYPDEIVLCPSRYLLLRFGYFSPDGRVLIPFSRDFYFPIDYDVVVRKYG